MLLVLRVLLVVTKQPPVLKQKQRKLELQHHFTTIQVQLQQRQQRQQRQQLQQLQQVCHPR